MKRVATTLTALILSAIIAFGTQYIIKKEKPTDDYSEETIGYVLREYNGMIGVFYQSGSTPFRIINIDINSLPENDKKELKSGVIAENESELNKRIEDYSS